MTVNERESLLMEHLPIVRDVATTLHRRSSHLVDLDDLISAGVVGLIDTLSKVEHLPNVDFKSYAAIRIRGAMLDSLRSFEWGPSALRRKARIVAETTRMLSLRNSSTPQEDEIAMEMGLPLAAFQTLTRDLNALELASLHGGRPINSSLEYLYAGHEKPEASPLSQWLKSEVEGRLKDKMQELPESERRVLKMYYYDELTMKQISVTLGVAEARVSQIHSAAIRKLRCALKRDKSTDSSALSPLGYTADSGRHRTAISDASSTTKRNMTCGAL